MNKARSATANAESKEALYAGLKQLEDILLPGESNLGTTIGQFFSSLQEIATAPSDLAPRVVALEDAKMVADNFTDVSNCVAVKGRHYHQPTRIGLIKHATEESLLDQELAAGRNKAITRC